MRVCSIALFCLLFSIHTKAQIGYDGQPANWADKRFPSHLTYRVMPEPDRDVLAAEDEVVDQYKEAPWRFGVEHDVDLTPFNSGSWSVDPETGREVWQLAIWCPGATSMSFLFGKYELKKGDELFIWSEDRTRFLGKFDHRNTSESGVFPIGLIHSERAVVELSVPPGRSSDIGLELNQVVHGYRSLLREEAEEEGERGPFGNSGSCNINVNCSQGASWQVEKRSVALIVSGGYAICTGALVNNTAQNGIPYFLTANHCTPSSASNVANWVFYFNHETVGCSGSTGPTNQSISGSVLRARRAGSDFALLQLNNTPPAGWNVQYAGWDRSDNAAAVTSAVGIHHPSGDVKKICFENNAPFKTTVQSTAVWYINQWELGVTEGGSSGSPLFNQDHRIIGQLLGGGAACSNNPNLPNNGQPDWYGRFGISWNTGTTQATRLREWLDPLNLNPQVLDGYPVAPASGQHDAGVESLPGLSGSICQSLVSPIVQLTNSGTQTMTSCTILYSINGGNTNTYNWSGSLPAGQNALVYLPSLSVVNGMNTLVVTVSAPNGLTDANASNNTLQIQFNAFTGPTYNSVLSITLDNYPAETSWEITQNGNVIYSSNGNYANETNGSTIQIPLCFGDGCYALVMKDSQGDGLCCQYGQGSYTLTNNFGQVVASGAQFQFAQTTNFCISAVGVEEEAQEWLLLYPNPAEQMIQIRTSGGGRKPWQIHDVAGRTVAAGELSGTSTTIDISNLSPGFYAFRCVEGTSVQTATFLVRR